MATTITCPHCGQLLKSIRPFEPGALLKCPQCQERFRYEDPTKASVGTTPPLPKSAEPTAADPCVNKTSGGRMGFRLFAGLAILVLAGCAWYFGRGLLSGNKTNSGSYHPENLAERGAGGAARVTPMQLLSSLPQDKHPKPGPDGQAQRDAANQWLKANVAGKTVDVQFVVEDVEILDQGDGTHHANMRVTINPKLDGPASLNEGVWGGDFKFNGIPYYIEYWGENPLWSGLSQSDAEQLRGLKGKQVDFRCKTNDFELQEGDDADQLKLVVTFAEIKPPGDKPAPPPESRETPTPESPEAPLVAANTPANKRDRGSSPAEETNENPPAARIGPPKEFASAGPPGVLQRDENPSSILDVGWSPDGRQVVAFDNGGLATLWDVTTSRGRDVSPTNEGPEKAGALRNRNRHVAFSPDGKTLVVGTSWKIAVVDLPAGRIRWETGAEFGMGPLVIDPGMNTIAVLVPTSDNEYAPTVSVRDLAKGTELFRSPPVQEGIPLAIAPNGKLLAIEDGVKTKVRLFDVPARKELPGITGVARAADMVFSSDGGRLLLPEAGYDSQVWDVSDPTRPSQLKRTPIGQDGLLGKLRADKKYTTLSGDAHTIASWKPESDTVVLLDATTGATQTTWNTGSQGESQPEISCVALNTDGSRAAIGTIAGTIVLRNAGQTTRSVPTLATLRFTRPSQFLRDDKDLDSPPHNVWFSPDGKWLITNGKTTTVWDIPARRQHMVLALNVGDEVFANRPKDIPEPFGGGFNKGIGPLRLNVTGWLLRTGSRTLTVSVANSVAGYCYWHYDLIKSQHRMDYNDPMSAGMKSSPDGRYAASWQYKRPDQNDRRPEDRPELVILEAQSARVTKSLGAFGTPQYLGEFNALSKLAFSADSRLLAAEVYGRPGTRGGSATIKLWNWESGQEIPTTAQAPVKFLDLVDSGRLLVTDIDRSEKVVFYDVQTGTRHHELDPSLGHASRVTAQAFAPIGPAFATGDEQGILLIRDLASGAERARVKAHDKSITAIGISHNGQQLATCAADGEIKIWALSSLLVSD